ncbi:MAG: hypothetical protein JW720_00575 [Sedimentisphaerales bacterium]|nr:hypothetical protein [Sedimentisphaerales bacterium]
MSNRHDCLNRLPLISLLAVNAIPVVGVLFAGWDAFGIVLLYWAENLAVGFYSILKIACIKVNHPKEHLGKLCAIPFFILHFGGFTGIHGIFVLTMFGKSNGDFMHRTTWPCFFAFIQILLNVISQALSIMTPEMRLAVLALFASHGVSFVYNYLIKGEYARVDPGKIMTAPYARVAIMHVAIITGGFFLIAINSPAALLIVLVVLKTFLDVKLHRREHRTSATAKAG